MQRSSNNEASGGLHASIGMFEAHNKELMLTYGENEKILILVLSALGAI